MAKFLSKYGKFYMRDGKLLRPTNILEVPIVTTNLTYNGKAQSPTIYGYDENTMTIGGTTSAVNPGSYTTTFTPKDGYCWADDTTTVKSVIWWIDKAIGSVPTQSGTLTYTGSAQSPAWSNYSSSSLTLGGTTSGTNAGTYTATFTPKAHYKWSDGTSSAKSVTWKIGKAAGSLSLSASSLTIDANSTTGSFTVTRAGDGAISASSNNAGVATVSVSGNTITVTKKSAGSATITVSVAEGTNHTASASKTCTVGCRSTTGALPVGSSVYMNVGGFRTEFLVVNQGNPDASLYDSSCDGTWLLMRHVYEADFRWAKSSDHESYDESAAHSYLNGTFLGKFDSDIQNTIKQVKIPYGYKHPQTAIHSKEDGLAAKIFLLSAREVNYYGESTTIADGMPLKYFESCPTYAGTEEPRRVAKLLLGDHSYTASDGISWWLRSHNPGADSSGIDVWAVGPKGNSNGGFPTRSSGYGNRPALVLPFNTLVDANMNVIANST